MPGTEPTSAMRVGRDLTERVLLRAGAGESGELGLDASVGRIASKTSGLWESEANSYPSPRRPGGQPQARGAAAGVDGIRSRLSQAQPEPTWRRAPDLPVPLGRAGNQRSGPSLVQRHHLRADGQWVHVFGGGDGLVEPVCAGLGAVQQFGQRVLYPGLGGGAGGRSATVNFQHRSGKPVHQRGVSGGGGIGRGGREHGWAGPVDRQPVYPAALAERQTGRHLRAGLRRWVDRPARITALVWRLQPGASPGAGICHAWGVVSLARIVWGQAGGLALEMKTEASAASSPPFAPSTLTGRRGSLRAG